MDIIEADADDGPPPLEADQDDHDIGPPAHPPGGHAAPERLDGGDDPPKKHAPPPGTKHYTREEIIYFLQHPKEMRVYPKWKGIYMHPEKGTLGRYVKKDMWAEIVPEEDIPKVLENIYKNPRLGYSGGQKLWTYVWQHFIGITSHDVRDFLKTYEPHQLHQGIHAAHVTRPIVVSRPGRHWQMDLANLWEYRHHNKGFTYLLVFIDVNSKFMFAQPIKRKFPENVLEPLKKILEDLEELGLEKPGVVQSDNGAEFLGVVDDFLAKQKIKHIFSTSHNPRSQAVVERSNYTIKSMLGKWMTDNDTRRWTDVLQDIVDNYNNSYHSTIRMTPREALLGDKTTIGKVYNRLKSAANKLERRMRTQPQLKVGDFVRLSLIKEDAEERKLYQSGFRKTGSIQNWSKQIYKVVNVSSGERNEHVSMRESYKVADLDGTKKPGRYFRHHLLKTVNPDDVVHSAENPEPDIQKLDDEYKNREFDDDPEQKERAEAHLERGREEPVALRVRKRKPDIPESKEEKIDMESDGEETKRPDEAKTIKVVKKPKGMKVKKKDDEHDEQEEDLYVPEKIIGEKKVKGKKLYKIKWMGYPASESTWEPLKNIVRGGEGLLEEWNKKKEK